MIGLATIVHRLWTGIFILSLLLAPLAGRTMEAGSKDKELSIHGRSVAIALVVASPSLFAKPISAPAPTNEALAVSPFLLFLTVLAAGWLLVPGGRSALSGPEAPAQVPWLHARVRAVELRV